MMKDEIKERIAEKMRGNRNAAKPEEARIYRKGRIIADFGDLKGRCIRAARIRGMKLSKWLRMACEEQCRRDEAMDALGKEPQEKLDGAPESE